MDDYLDDTAARALRDGRAKNADKAIRWFHKE